MKSPLRVNLMRASIYGCSVMLQALKDTEIEELKAEVDAIKQQIEGLKL